MLSGAVMHPTCVLFLSPGPSLRLKGRLEILLCDTIKWRSLTLFSDDAKRLFSCKLKPLFKRHGVFYCVTRQNTPGVLGHFWAIFVPIANVR